MCVLSCFSCVQLSVTLWTIDCQGPLSRGFPRHEYWSGLPCPPPGDLHVSGIKLMSLISPALAGRGFPGISDGKESSCKAGDPGLRRSPGEGNGNPSILAWRIPGTGEPGEVLSMGSHRVGHD